MTSTFLKLADWFSGDEGVAAGQQEERTKVLNIKRKTLIISVFCTKAQVYALSTNIYLTRQLQQILAEENLTLNHWERLQTSPWSSSEDRRSDSGLWWFGVSCKSVMYRCAFGPVWPAAAWSAVCGRRRPEIRLGHYLVQFEWMSRHSAAEDEKHTHYCTSMSAWVTLTFTAVNVW